MNKIKEVLARSISVMLMVTLLSSLSFFDVSYVLGTVEAQAAPTKTRDDAKAWLASIMGTSYDVDGAPKNENIYQCVDLIYGYYRFFGLQSLGGDASAYTSPDMVPSGWKRIVYTNGVTPQFGDILVYTNGGDGHVAIYYDTNRIVHQNWTYKINGEWVRYSYVHYLNLKYNNISPNYKLSVIIRPDFLVKTTAIKLSTNKIETTRGTLSKSSVNYQWPLVATVYPSDATYKKVTWSSSTKSVADVDQNGVIKATGKVGITTITARTQDGQVATCIFKVYK